MKKGVIFFLFMLVGFSCYSQISFEKGYYIDNSGQKVDCLIKNSDWLDNPVDFQYRFSIDSNIKRAKINEVKAFEIYNVGKYIRSNVNIDISDVELSNLSRDRNPIFKEVLVFLEVLVEGEASLYAYSEGKSKKFFYNLRDSNPEQLVYKTYIISGSKIAENEMYKQQLWGKLECPNFEMNDINSLHYKKSSLVDFFISYNQCGNQDFASYYEKKQKKGSVNLNIRPGLSISSLSLNHSLSNTLDAKFDAELTFRLGVELEFVLPFNKNKWGVILEPTYQYYKSETSVAIQNVRVDYSSFEIPAGLRYYFFLNDDSKVFINGSVVFDFPGKSIIEYDNGLEYNIKPVTNFAFGLGYQFKSKYALELRYYTNRELLNNDGNWFSDYKTFSVIFGYSIF
jgi:hypothetical protein